MPDLVLRPSGLPAPKDWSLQLRYHDCCGPTEYATLCYVSRDTAENIIEAGNAFWLLGPPDELAELKDRAARRAALSRLAQADAELL